ncbi:spore germination protein [Melghirimyces profundicolus]|uniref:Spore germination protein n=1 Tax=Melghirimyces profundicolus TaxID=1242148 RepID=A0A2T6C8Q2_9BACL|nr:Ger(x)C family spore germination protein [Melghirimyces profundicolus]PTX64704.1 spore germination protein [Melghirimyces profundicolus]
MKKLGKGLLIVSMVISLTGCSWGVKSNIIEEISPTILKYIDREPDGQLKVSTLIPPLRKEKKRVITEKARLEKEARNEISQKYYRELKSGQLRMLFLSKRLARTDILPILNTWMLDPEISHRLYLAVVEGDFVSFLHHQLQVQELIDFNLYQMFSHYEQQGEINVTNLHRFMEAYFSPYADSMVPLFTLKDNELTYKGTALFREGKMVGEITSLDDILFQMLSHKNWFQKTLPLPEQGIILGSLYTESKVTAPPSGDVKIQVGLKGKVDEYQGKRNLNQSKEVKQLTRELESVLEQKITRIMHQLQQWRVDPLRVGERTLGPLSQPYSEKSWKAAWPDKRIDVKVRLQLESLGLLELTK